MIAYTFQDDGVLTTSVDMNIFSFSDDDAAALAAKDKKLARAMDRGSIASIYLWHLAGEK